MNCYLCGGDVFDVLSIYDRPDKYEKWMGIDDIIRHWGRCIKCGFIQAGRSYPLSDLEAIYKTGYRDSLFRGVDIKEVYVKIMMLPFESSENRQRCKWLKHHTERGEILDIGSGLGVFPVVMRSLGYDVECVEENLDSLNFLRELGFVAHDKKPKKTYDIVSLVHVLEHIDDPISFLSGLKSNVREWLFIEVPDAEEFERLEKDHDEFNSCHVKFYNPDTLTEIIERSGFHVNRLVKKYYKDRDLSRILALCE